MRKSMEMREIKTLMDQQAKNEAKKFNLKVNELEQKITLDSLERV